jgi:diaminohydroxyphosphoribosylaminopyrimidine deaminase/5-amino-6-(5-phosphoribosylamino)uracil reductase
LPFVTVNFVMSLDGKIATRGRQSLWPSGEKAREILYDLWHAVDVIMVGSKTVVADGLYATTKSCRGRGGAEKKQPLCLIVDSKGKISSKSRVFEKPGDKLLAVTRYALNDEKKREFSKKGVEVLEIQEEGGHLNLRELLLELGRRKLSTVLVKGGGNLFGAFFDRGLADKIVVSILPVIVGGNRARTAVGGEGARLLSEVTRLTDVQVKEIDGNIMTSGYVGRRDVHRDS